MRLDRPFTGSLQIPQISQLDFGRGKKIRKKACKGEEREIIGLWCDLEKGSCMFMREIGRPAGVISLHATNLVDLAHKN